MVFSERAVINFEHGIRFRSDSLRSIGVYHKTQCWGVWTPDLNRTRSSTSPGCIRSVGQYHLVVSPFHPVSWPYLVRIRVELADRIDAMQTVTKELGSLRLRKHLRQTLERMGCEPSEEDGPDGLNILHLDQSPTGYSHSSCTMVAEVLAARDLLESEKERLDRRWPQTREPGSTDHRAANEEARKFGNRLSHVMLEARVLIKRSLDALAGKHLIYERLRLRKFSLGSPDPDLEQSEDQESDLAKAWRKHPPSAHSVKWLYELPFHAVFGGGDSAPIGMSYDGRTKQLIAAHRFEYPGPSDFRAMFLSGRSYLTIASFDPHEHSVRLVPIPDRIRTSRMALVEIDYRARSRGAAIPGLTHGLVADVTHVLRHAHYDVLSVLNKPRESSLRGEYGHIRFLAIRPSPMEEPHKERARLRKRIEDIPSRSARPSDDDDTNSPTKTTAGATEPPEPRIDLELDVRCTEPAVSRVFISLNFSHPRKKNLIKLVRRSCHQCGLEAVIAETYTDTATDYVVSKINDCDAFLQILVEPPMDRERRRTWLDFEYGMASGRNLPRVRLVDVSSRPYLKWGEIVDIDRDRFCRPIDLSLGDRDLAKQLRKAIREIAGKIGRDLSPPDRRSGT
ncbi:MAG: hypothetical protein AB7T19_17015 [Planctomycetota bacterium]